MNALQEKKGKAFSQRHLRLRAHSSEIASFGTVTFKLDNRIDASSSRVLYAGPPQSHTSTERLNACEHLSSLRAFPQSHTSTERLNNFEHLSYSRASSRRHSSNTYPTPWEHTLWCTLNHHPRFPSEHAVLAQLQTTSVSSPSAFLQNASYSLLFTNHYRLQHNAPDTSKVLLSY
jgi:hypothetical protein